MQACIYVGAVADLLAPAALHHPMGQRPTASVIYRMTFKELRAGETKSRRLFHLPE
jgi:hypothetical protein